MVRQFHAKMSDDVKDVPLRIIDEALITPKIIIQNDNRLEFQGVVNDRIRGRNIDIILLFII